MEIRKSKIFLRPSRIRNLGPRDYKPRAGPLSYRPAFQKSIFTERKILLVLRCLVHFPLAIEAKLH